MPLLLRQQWYAAPTYMHVDNEPLWLILWPVWFPPLSYWVHIYCRTRFPYVWFNVCFELDLSSRTTYFYQRAEYFFVKTWSFQVQIINEQKCRINPTITEYFWCGSLNNQRLSKQTLLDLYPYKLKPNMRLSGAISVRPYIFTDYHLIVDSTWVFNTAILTT